MTIGVKLTITYKSKVEVQHDIDVHSNDADPKLLWLAYMDMWNATGAAGVPAGMCLSLLRLFCTFHCLFHTYALIITDKVRQHREKYFKGIHFTTIEELIRKADSTDSSVIL